MAAPIEGWKFSVHTEQGGLVFEKVYDDEYMEDAFAAWIRDCGGLELGTKLEIVEVVAPDLPPVPLCALCEKPAVSAGFCLDCLPF